MLLWSALFIIAEILNKFRHKGLSFPPFPTNTIQSENYEIQTAGIDPLPYQYFQQPVGVFSGHPNGEVDGFGEGGKADLSEVAAQEGIGFGIHINLAAEVKGNEFGVEAKLVVGEQYKIEQVGVVGKGEAVVKHQVAAVEHHQLDGLEAEVGEHHKTFCRCHAVDVGQKWRNGMSHFGVRKKLPRMLSKHGRDSVNQITVKFRERFELVVQRAGIGPQQEVQISGQLPGVEHAPRNQRGIGREEQTMGIGEGVGSHSGFIQKGVQIHSGVVVETPGVYKLAAL